MPTSRKMLGFLVCAFALDLALVLFSWTLDPVALRRLVPLGVLVVLWLVAELGQQPRDERGVRIRDWHRLVLGTTALLLAFRMGLRVTFALEVLGEEWLPVARRSAGAVGGVLLILWGNHLPKLLSPWSYRDQPFDWQGVHRFVGWTAALSGAAMVVVWIVVPIELARWTSVAICGAFVLVAVGRKLVSVATHAPDPPGVTS